MKTRLQIAQERFLGICPYCKAGLKKVEDVNILRCENPNCKGVKTPSGYRPYYQLLSDRRMDTYNKLFKNKK